jgi:periplasmic protein TonB
MDNQHVLNNSFNELVFENRHKDYGAYEIRRRYTRSVLMAGLIASVTVFAAISFSLFTKDEVTAVLPTPEGVREIPMNISPDKPKEEEPKKEEQQQKIETKKGVEQQTQPEVKPEAKPITAIPNDSIGDPKGKLKGIIGLPKDTGSGKCIDCLVKSPPKKDSIHVFVSNPPVFDVDKFFLQNTKYPSIARENGIQGVVYLSWVVDEDGAITDIQVVKSANPNLDREALRVAKMMPKWDPAENNGEKVKFRFTKPVRFTLK